MMKFLALTLHLLAKITLTLISSSGVTGCVQKVNLLPSSSCMRYVGYSKNRLLYVEIIAFYSKIRDTFLCVKRLYIKVMLLKNFLD